MKKKGKNSPAKDKNKNNKKKTVKKSKKPSSKVSEIKKSNKSDSGMEISSEIIEQILDENSGRRRNFGDSSVLNQVAIAPGAPIVDLERGAIANTSSTASEQDADIRYGGARSGYAGTSETGNDQEDRYNPKPLYSENVIDAQGTTRDLGQMGIGREDLTREARFTSTAQQHGFQNNNTRSDSERGYATLESAKTWEGPGGTRKSDFEKDIEERKYELT